MNLVELARRSQALSKCHNSLYAPWQYHLRDCIKMNSKTYDNSKTKEILDYLKSYPYFKIPSNRQEYKKFMGIARMFYGSY